MWRLQRLQRVAVTGFVFAIAVPSWCNAQTAAAPQELKAEASEPQPFANSSNADPAATALGRLTRDIKYLASAELGGRQPGTPEMKLAEEFIIEQFEQAGVAGGGTNGSYRQAVDVEGKRSINTDITHFKLTGPDDTDTELELKKAFTPLLGRKPNSVASSLVFVGYGISAPEHNYDEYANIDVKDKVVVLIRREPQQSSEDSVFDGDITSEHSFITSKVKAAKRAGAAGIVMVNDQVTAPDEARDSLVQSGQFGTISFPFYQIQRATLNTMLAAAPLYTPAAKKISTLADAEAWIDGRLEPLSQPLTGWSIDAAASFSKNKIDTSNLIGVIEGQGELADETVIIGGHYDHLGRGAYGSRTPDRKEIHFGADDNATGTAGTLELARRFAAKAKDNPDAPRRRLVFICFTAEEMGLLGALHYVNSDPLYDLKKTVAMVNYDMIGLLREDELTVFNWNTSPAFDAILKNANQDLGLKLKLPAAAFAGSDHLPFNQVRIPNMFIHTGISDTYHTPDDTFETINCEGVTKVVDFTESVLDQLITSDRPSYGTPKRFRLGLRFARSKPAENGKSNGLLIAEVADDTPASRAEFEAGDRILSFNDDQVRDYSQLVLLIRAHAAQDVVVTLRRGKEEIKKDVSLDDDILGVTLAETEAEMQTTGGLQIDEVVPDSAAARAGFESGDVIESIDGDAMTKRRQVSRLIRRDAGKEVTFKIRRGDETKDIPVLLKDR